MLTNKVAYLFFSNTREKELQFIEQSTNHPNGLTP